VLDLPARDMTDRTLLDTNAVRYVQCSILAGGAVLESVTRIRPRPSIPAATIGRHRLMGHRGTTMLSSELDTAALTTTPTESGTKAKPVRSSGRGCRRAVSADQ
jgi:hypothetical protein